MACACGGKYMWSYDTTIKSDRPDRQFKVDVYKCMSCSSIFFVDKDCKRLKKEKRPTYVPSIMENTPDEEIFFGRLYIESKGKYGVKPKGYVATKIGHHSVLINKNSYHLFIISVFKD